MARSAYASIVVSVLLMASLYCGKKPTEAGNTPVANSQGNDGLPPKGSATDAPEFVRSLSLLYPQAELYRVDNRLIQKSNHRLSDIVAYFSKTLTKHGFSETAKLEQSGGALLQYERRTKGAAPNVQVCRAQETFCNNGETISIDINKLPYADNFLIRVGRSEVDYSKGNAN